MPYDLLIDTYETERIKVISVWSEFTDDDLPVRPRPGDPRGRSVHEQMVHQCVSEDLWFRGMLGIDVDAPPLAGTGNSFGIHEALCRRQRKAPRGLAREARSLVGGRHDSSSMCAGHERGS